MSDNEEIPPEPDDSQPYATLKNLGEHGEMGRSYKKGLFLSGVGMALGAAILMQLQTKPSTPEYVIPEDMGTLEPLPRKDIQEEEQELPHPRGTLVFQRTGTISQGELRYTTKDKTWRHAVEPSTNFRVGDYSTSPWRLLAKAPNIEQTYEVVDRTFGDLTSSEELETLWNGTHAAILDQKHVQVVGFSLFPDQLETLAPLSQHRPELLALQVEGAASPDTIRAAAVYLRQKMAAAGYGADHIIYKTALHPEVLSKLLNVDSEFMHAEGTPEQRAAALLAAYEKGTLQNQDLRQLIASILDKHKQVRVVVTFKDGTVVETFPNCENIQGFLAQLLGVAVLVACIILFTQPLNVPKKPQVHKESCQKASHQ